MSDERYVLVNGVPIAVKSPSDDDSRPVAPFVEWVSPDRRQPDTREEACVTCGARILVTTADMPGPSDCPYCALRATGRAMQIPAHITENVVNALKTVAAQDPRTARDLYLHWMARIGVARVTPDVADLIEGRQ